MDKIKVLKQEKKLCAIFSNITMLLQFLSILLIIMFSLYMFLQLMHNHALDFLKPLADFSKGLIHALFGNSIKSSKEELDGELAVFIIINIALVFIYSQIKTALKRRDEVLDKKIVEEKLIEEEKFNRELKAELQRNISSYNSFMVGFTLKASYLVSEALQIYGEEKPDIDKMQLEALMKFLEVAKSIPGIKILKEGNIILLISEKFESVDVVLCTIQDTISKLKKEYKEKKIILKTRLAIEAYKPMTSFKNVLATVKPLLELNAGSDVLCYGNFNNRYAMLKNPRFDVVVKGKYDIENSEQTVWALVKKI